MTTENTKQESNLHTDEIDLVRLAKILWINRTVLTKVILIFTTIGLLVAILSPKEYSAKTVIVPQLGEGQSKFGGLSSLAAMAGFSISPGSSGSELSPTIYPQIVASIPFELELMNTPLKFKNYTTPITLFDYFTKIKNPSIKNLLKRYTIGLPKVIIRALRGKSNVEELNANEVNRLIQLTEDQLDVKKILLQIISLEVNAKEGYLVLSTIMPEAQASGQLAQRAQELLQQYIIEFKIKKTKANLDFIQQRYDETEKKFEEAQERLAQFRDRNKNVTSATSRTEEERLTSQYSLIFGVFSDLAKQLEQAKIQVKQDTPVFTIIEPVSIPTEKSKPNRSLIMFIWIVLGGISGTIYIFVREYLQSLKRRWNE